MPVIQKWEKYLSAGGEASLEGFARWLLEGSKEKKMSLDDGALQTYFDRQTNDLGYSPLNSEASFLLWRLNKFLKQFTKTLFQDAGLNNQDEFAILSHVDYKSECTKKLAIEENLIDLTTGVEIIKRLVSRGFLKEKINKHDKRERLISLTPKGKKTLQDIYKGFSGVQDVLVDLNAEERERLVHTLKNLDTVHTKQYQEKSSGRAESM
ncbi:MAG: winged helix-turn-helix transcriptional regulator [Rhizobacter sp.]|nr:winged helix-turn-helix transcriptional regulator [Chlorobiales bacterium]